MLFRIIAIGVPALLYMLLPKILKAGQDRRRVLLAACCVYFVSWFLPSPLINGQQTQFMTHLVGGGIFTGLLWFYIKLVTKWNTGWWVEAASLFMLVSSLGVMNELFEVVLFQFGYMPHGITDTSYDLVANTLGAAIFFIAYALSGGGKNRNGNSRNR